MKGRLVLVAAAVGSLAVAGCSSSSSSSTSSSSSASAGGVEERETLPQRREAGPDRVDVHACAEHFGHGSSLLARAARECRPVDIEFTTAGRVQSSPLALA